MILLLIKLMWVSIVPTSPVGVVTYIQETKLDGNYYEFRDGETELYFTSDEALYVHLRVPDKMRIEQGEGTMMKIIDGDVEGFPIYQNRRNEALQVKISMIGTDGKGAVVLEAIPRIDWKIQPDETRQIGKYTCRKAVGVFGGRVYDAWFTPEIPVPHGPYKLGGLPGLILEAHSRDGKVSFHFKSLEWVEKPSRAIAPPTGKFVFQSWDEQNRKNDEIVHKRNMMLRSEDPNTRLVISEAPKGDFTIEKKNTP